MSLFIRSFVMAAVFFLSTNAIAEIRTYVHTVRQPFGGSQSPDDARVAALAKAKREVLEKAGTYLESLTVVKNFAVEKDEILALAAGVLRTEIVSQENYVTGEAFGVAIVAKVDVDTSILSSRIKKYLSDRTYLEQVKQLKEREKKLLERIGELESKNRAIAELPVDKQQTERKILRKRFQKVTQDLTATELLQKVADLMLVQQQKFSDPMLALKYLDQVIEMEPDYLAYSLRGMTNNELGQYEKAISDYNNAIRLEPNIWWFYNSRGNTFNNLRRHQHAIKDFNRAIQINPAAYKAYVNRGNAYNYMKNYKKALEDYNVAIKLSSKYPMTYYNRAYLYIALKQPQNAIKDFTQAVHLNPNYTDAYLTRGYVYESTDKHQLAIEDFNQAIKLNPACHLAYLNRALSKVSLGHRQLALEDFNKAIELKPDFPPSYLFRGRCCKNLGQHKNAIEDFNKAIQLDPDYTKPYIERAIAYWNLCKYKKANKDFDQAIKLDTTSVDALSKYAWYLATCSQKKYRMGKKALELAKKAVSISKTTETLDTLAAAYAEIGHFNDAIKIQEQAIEMVKKGQSVPTKFKKRLETYRSEKPWREK